ncbi:unnamed protein product [Heligmosomoides polygyrus]|uniref:G_PROTEIN_RECEP_F1_2 domain-containing protein n=1 Tax=Heligmosomoides polygyrus TaxID=6339 RepID=A0A183GEV6_HELPZ|nr:unnamed protein product [Heligmosomoides polygyrus]
MTAAIERTVLLLSGNVSVYVPVFLSPNDTVNSPLHIALKSVYLFETLASVATIPLNYLTIRGLSRTTAFHRNLCRIAQVLFSTDSVLHSRTNFTLELFPLNIYIPHRHNHSCTTSLQSVDSYYYCTKAVFYVTTVSYTLILSLSYSYATPNMSRIRIREKKQRYAFSSRMRHTLYFYGMSWRWFEWVFGHEQVSTSANTVDNSSIKSPTLEGWKAWLLAWAEKPNHEPGIGCMRQPAPPPTAPYAPVSRIKARNSYSFSSSFGGGYITYRVVHMKCVTQKTIDNFVQTNTNKKNVQPFERQENST